MIRGHSQDSWHSLLSWSVLLNGGVFVYELRDCRVESRFSQIVCYLSWFTSYLNVFDNFSIFRLFYLLLPLLEMLDTAVQFFGKNYLFIYLFIIYSFILQKTTLAKIQNKKLINTIQKQINEIKKQYLSNVLQNKINI